MLYSTVGGLEHEALLEARKQGIVGLEHEALVTD